MYKFVLSGFADEISPDFDIQLDSLNKLDIKYIELRGVDGTNIADISDEKLYEIKEKLEKHDIKVSAIGSPIGKIGILDDFTPQLEKFKRVLEIAKELDCPYIRMFSFFIPDEMNPDIYYHEVIVRWKMYVRAARRYNVTLLHENEKGIYGDTAKRCLKLVKTLDTSKVGITFDSANFVQCGQDTLEAYTMLKPYIKYIHIKDAKKDGTVVPCGHGDGNMDSLIELLKNDQYYGFTSLEPHLADFKGFSELEKPNEETKLSKQSNIDTFCLARDEFLKIVYLEEEF